MLDEALKQLKIAFLLLLTFTILTGLIYPGVVTGIAQVFFSWHANGSLIQANGKTIGSELIGQSFTDPKYFFGRPSATTPFPYNAASSTGSNLGPTNPDLLATIKSRVIAFQQIDPGNYVAIPVDLVTASGSGLDPEISVRAAYYQVNRIAKIRKIDELRIRSLIQNLKQKNMAGSFGETRINVLELNLALDQFH